MNIERLRKIMEYSDAHRSDIEGKIKKQGIILEKN